MNWMPNDVPYSLAHSDFTVSDWLRDYFGDDWDRYSHGRLQWCSTYPLNRCSYRRLTYAHARCSADFYLADPGLRYGMKQNFPNGFGWLAVVDTCRGNYTRAIRRWEQARLLYLVERDRGYVAFGKARELDLLELLRECVKLGLQLLWEDVFPYGYDLPAINKFELPTVISWWETGSGLEAVKDVLFMEGKSKIKAINLMAQIGGLNEAISKNRRQN